MGAPPAGAGVGADRGRDMAGLNAGGGIVDDDEDDAGWADEDEGSESDMISMKNWDEDRGVDWNRLGRLRARDVVGGQLANSRSLP